MTQEERIAGLEQNVADLAEMVASLTWVVKVTDVAITSLEDRSTVERVTNSGRPRTSRHINAAMGGSSDD
jgi:hypothetical protein